MTDCPTCGQSVDKGPGWFLKGCLLVQDGRVAHLSSYEAEILRFLRHATESLPITGAALDWHIFKNMDVNASNIVKVTLYRLRKKIERAKINIEIHCESRAWAGREEALYWLTL